MGFLTTLTFYNDHIGQLEGREKEFVDKVIDAVHQGTMMNHPVDIALGNSGNFARVQTTRHADDHTIYVHMGNTVVELGAWSRESERLMRYFPDFYEQIVSFIKQNLKSLDEKYKLIKQGEPNGKKSNSSRSIKKRSGSNKKSRS